MKKKLRIIFLADINSAHTQKWVIALVRSGVEVGLFTMFKPKDNWFLQYPEIKILHTSNNDFSNDFVYKLSYFKAIPYLKKAIKDFKPDLLHSHYATSYGLIGALSGFHPHVISAWGSDVMNFPEKSYFHKTLLKFNLKRADLVLATSNAIVKAIDEIIKVKIKIIPFGIDLNYFKPTEISKQIPQNTLVIGTVKSLEYVYGIDILIKAFKSLKENNKNKKIKLLIVGGGSKENEYKFLVEKLNIKDDVEFTGKVTYDDVIKYHNAIDIFVNVSRNESFGVSVLEASACGNPVIATNVGGLPEVILKDETGILIESENIDETINAIEKLLSDEPLRIKMGENGKRFVRKYYNFENNVEDTLAVYNQLIQKLPS